MKPKLLLFSFLLLVTIPVVAQETPAPSIPASLTEADVQKLYGKPTLVSLDAKDMLVTAAYAEIARQAGFYLPASGGIRLYNDTIVGEAQMPRVTVALANLPFWQSADKIAEASGYSLVQRAEYGKGSGRQFRFLIEPTITATGLPHNQGLIEASLTSIKRMSEQTIPLGTVPKHLTERWRGHHDLNYAITVRCDPKLPIVPGTWDIRLSSTPKLSSSYSGLNAWSWFRNGEHIFQVNYNWYTSDVLRRSYHQPDAPDLRSVKVDCSALLVTKTAEWRITDLSTLPKEYTFGEQTLILQAVKYSPRRVEIEVKLKDKLQNITAGTPFNPIRYAQQSLMGKSLALVDSKGQWWEPTMPSSPQIFQLRDSVEKDPSLLKFLYVLDENAQAPFWLRWQIPTEVQRMETTFEWNGLPVP